MPRALSPMSAAQAEPSFSYTLRYPVHDLGSGTRSPRNPFNTGYGWVSWLVHGNKASEDEAGLDHLS